MQSPVPLSPAVYQWGDIAPPPRLIVLLSVMGGVVGLEQGKWLSAKSKVSTAWETKESWVEIAFHYLWVSTGRCYLRCWTDSIIPRVLPHSFFVLTFLLLPSDNPILLSRLTSKAEYPRQ